MDRGMADKMLNFTADILPGMMSAELIWENASPTSNFPAQVIPIDLSKYDNIEATFIPQPAWSAKEQSEVCLINKSVSLTYSFRYNSTTSLYSRDISATPTGVVVSQGFNGDAASGIVIIPQKIYGIKILST